MGEQLVEDWTETLAVRPLKRSRMARMAVEVPRRAQWRAASRPRPVSGRVTMTVLPLIQIRKSGSSNDAGYSSVKTQGEDFNNIRFRMIWYSHEQLAVEGLAG